MPRSARFRRTDSPCAARFPRADSPCAARFCRADRTVRKGLLAFALLLLLPLPLRAQAPQWVDDFALSIPLQLTADAKHIGRNYALRVTPFLASAEGDTLRLASTVFRSRRNARLTKRHRHFREMPLATSKEYLVGDTVSYNAIVTKADAPWLFSEKDITLGYERELEGCCHEKPLPLLTLATFAYKKPEPVKPPYQPVITLPFVALDKGVGGEHEKKYGFVADDSRFRPYALSDTLSKDSTLLRVHFPLDKITLLRDFRGNDTILDRIVNVTRDILADTRSDVTRIQIIGLASVEGTQKRNSWLGQGRAEALRDYVMAHTAATNDLFVIHNGAEAWTELNYAIRHADFEGRDALLSIMETETNLDRREARMKAYDGGRPWKYVKQHILPDQRNSGYLRIYYKAKPDSVGMGINDAIRLVNEGNPAEGLRLLQAFADNPRAWNALGAAYYQNGNEAAAEEYFRKAADNGDDTARRNLNELHKARTR